MTAWALTGIGQLVTNDPDVDGSALGVMRDAALVVDGDRISWVGSATEVPAADRRVDAAGAAVLPGFVDSHSHLVFAGDRAAEFSARMAGQPYAAGGIQSTVAATRAATDAELLANAERLLAEMRSQGITTTEIKTGYGLTLADEVRAARVAHSLTPETTVLAAHVVPNGRDADEYTREVIEVIVPACAEHARWVDVFCEDGAFDAEQSRAVLHAGLALGLQARVHANQLRHGPGVQLACEVGAASADHCTFVDESDLAALAESGTVATLLPGAEFSTRMPYPDARRFLDAGVTVALATDCNPGSSFTTSMPLMIALAVREMRMTVAEAVWAATAGGAAALRREDIGRLKPGSRADLMVLDAPDFAHLAYRPGVPLVGRTFVSGRAAEAM